jgi:hypothetical protein
VYVTEVVEPADIGFERFITNVDPTTLKLVTVVGYPLVVMANCVGSGGAELKRDSLKASVNEAPSEVFVIPVSTGGTPSAMD